MTRISVFVMGVAVATLFFAFLALTAHADTLYGTVTQTTLEDFNEGDLYHTGLTRYTGGGGDGDGEVRLLTVGIAGEWYTNTNATGLPALTGLAAVQHDGYIYVIGGYNGSARIRNVYYSRILTETHDLTNWQNTTPLPASAYPNGVYQHGAAVVNRRIYVAGGWDQNASDYFDTVAHAPLSADGTVGTWSTTTPLPQKILFARMVTMNGRLYVLGGQRTTAPIALDTVYYAEPDPVTGVITPGGWMTTTALPKRMYGHTVTAWDNWVYVAGGYDGTTFFPYVYYATPITNTGAIAVGGWTTTTKNMKYNLYGAAMVAFAGELFTTGGAQNNNSTPSDYVGAALIDPDGDVRVDWVDTSLIDPKRFFHAAVTSDDGWLYVIGGAQLGGQPIGAPLVNRGATSGEGARNYAPDGEFTSSIIDLGGDRTVTQLAWNTFISDTAAMTVTMSYRTQPHDGSWSDWQGPYPSAAQTGVATTTLPLSVTARYLQYEAFFSTAITDATPVLNQVQFTYELPNYDLQLAKDDARDVVYLGDVITYTFRYTNTGGAEALGVYITETVPAYTTPYGPNTGWTDVGGGQYRYHATDVLSSSHTGQATFVVRVDPWVPDVATSVYDRAIIEAQGADATPGDNLAEHSTPLAWFDLHAMLSDDVAIARPGDVLTYTATVTNGGTISATGGLLTLTIPAHTAPHGANPGWTSVGGGQYERDLGAISPGDPVTATFTVQVDDPLPPEVTSLTATTVVTDDGSHGPDPAPDNNTASDTDLLSWIDLRLTLSDGITTTRPGAVLTYTATYTNGGNVTATGSLLTLTIPAHTASYGTNPGWTNVGGGQYERDLGAVAPSSHSQATFTVQVDDPVDPSVTSLTATAVIADDGAHGPDPEPADNAASDTDALSWIDLSLMLSDGVTTAQPGDVLVYTVAYTHSGSVTATGGLLTLTIPAHTAPHGVNPGWTNIGGGQYERALGAVEPGSHSQATFTVQVDDPVDPGVTSLTATAVITDDGTYGPDMAPADNADTDTDNLSWVDLVAHKTDGRTTVFHDQTLLYTITITNAGNATYSGPLYLTETLPQHTSYVDQGYGWSGTGLTWTKTMPVNLVPGTSATTYMAVHTSPTAPTGSLTNTVTAWVPGDLHPDLSTAYDVDVLVESAPNLVVGISDGATGFEICQVNHYTVQYRNDGNRTATSVVLSATLPADMTYVGTGWQTTDGQHYTRSLSDLAPGDNGTVTFSTALTRPVSLSRAMIRQVGDQPSRSPDDWPSQVAQAVSIRCAEPEDPTGNVAVDANDLRRPDLRVVSLTPIPGEAGVDQEVIFRTVIGNDGDAPVANACCGGFWVDLYVHFTHPPGGGEFSDVGVYGWVPNVSVQGTYTLDLVYTFQTTGTFTLYVQANPDRYWDIPESDFANNTSVPAIVEITAEPPGPPKIYLPLIVKSS